MGINSVRSGLSAAVGIQLPAVQSGPAARPGPRGKRELQEAPAGPWNLERKEGGCPCWGGPGVVREPGSGCEREQGRQGGEGSVAL